MNNNVSAKATVTEMVQQPSEMRWLATTRAFLEIPNPAIFKVFALSNIATFISGFALVIEWISHGRNHNGFEWIIYYALFLLCLPLLILIALRIFMVISSPGRGVVDSVEAKEDDLSIAKQTDETEKNNCRSLTLLVDSDERNKKEDKVPRIKRAVSFPTHQGVRSCRTR